MNFSKEIIIGIKKGNNNDFKKFYLESIDIFFRWLKTNYNLNDEDCKDILSEFYLKIWTKKEKIPLENYKNWIWLVFKNTVKDWFKQKKLINFTKIETKTDFKIEENISYDENFIEKLEKDFKLEDIKKALKNLDEIYQDIIFLKFIENKSNKEIAEILQISETNVRQRLSRAIKKLLYLINK